MGKQSSRTWFYKEIRDLGPDNARPQYDIPVKIKVNNDMVPQNISQIVKIFEPEIERTGVLINGRWDRNCN